MCVCMFKSNLPPYLQAKLASLLITMVALMAELKKTEKDLDALMKTLQRLKPEITRVITEFKSAQEQLTNHDQVKTDLLCLFMRLAAVVAITAGIFQADGFESSAEVLDILTWINQEVDQIEQAAQALTSPEPLAERTVA